MQSTACHYQCQNTNTCHTDVKQELITHLQGLLLSCIFWVTTLHSEGHRLPQYTHTPPLLHTGFLNTHTAFTAHRLPQHTHTHCLYCTQASSIHTPPCTHIYCTQASSTHTPPCTQVYCTQASSTHTPPCTQSTELHYSLRSMGTRSSPRKPWSEGDLWPERLLPLSPCNCYNMHTCVVNLPLLHVWACCQLATVTVTTDITRICMLSCVHDLTFLMRLRASLVR